MNLLYQHIQGSIYLYESKGTWNSSSGLATPMRSNNFTFLTYLQMMKAIEKWFLICWTKKHTSCLKRCRRSKEKCEPHTITFGSKKFQAQYWKIFLW